MTSVLVVAGVPTAIVVARVRAVWCFCFSGPGSSSRDHVLMIVALIQPGWMMSVVSHGPDRLDDQ